MGSQEVGPNRIHESTYFSIIPPTNGFSDECLKGEVHFSLGFADPGSGVGCAYVTSQMGTTLTGDLRDVALRQALSAALPASSGAPPIAA